MKITKTEIEDLIIIEPNCIGDDRGYFMESFKYHWFQENFPHIQFIQDNESKSKKGILRGLHFQLPPYEQTKLVRVIQGKVLDIAVDLRTSSITYGKSVSIILSDENKKQLLIPKGFAHGFIVLSDSAIFSYKVDNLYAPEYDSGIIWNDPDLKINWILNSNEIVLSQKDQNLQFFNAFKSPFL